MILPLWLFRIEWCDQIWLKVAGNMSKQPTVIYILTSIANLWFVTEACDITFFQPAHFKLTRTKTHTGYRYIPWEKNRSVLTLEENYVFKSSTISHSKNLTAKNGLSHINLKLFTFISLTTLQIESGVLVKLFHLVVVGTQWKFQTSNVDTNYLLRLWGFIFLF